MKISRGFTLIELVVMIGIIAVLAAVVGPRFVDRKTFDARGFFDQAASMFRYGQKLAIAQQRRVFVRINGASVALCYDSACNAGNRVNPPSGRGTGSTACSSDTGWFCEAPGTSITYSVSPGTLSMFYFDATGKPFDTSNVALNSNVAITVTGSGFTKSFTMERETGYVH